MTAADILEAVALRRARGDEFPYPATVCAERTIMVAVEDAADEVWRIPQAQHLLAPLDIVRTRDGLSYLFVPCESRLSVALAARHPLQAGEAVSVAVSLVRGATEASPLTDEGAWWLTDDGRPVLALGGGEQWLPATVALLEGLAADLTGAAADAIAVAAATLRDSATVRWADAEDALFAAAEPRALRSPPTHAVPLVARAAAADAPPRERALPRLLVHATSVWDAALAERVRIAAMSLTRGRPPRARRAARARTEPRARNVRRVHADSRARTAPRRRLPLLVAGGVAATIVVVGALWPEPPADGAPAPAATGVTSSPAPPAGAPTGDAEPMTVTDAVGALLAQWRSCEGACGADVLEDPQRGAPAALTPAAAAPGEIGLVDEYGGVAAVRVDEAGGAGRIVVVVDVAGKWLIRDVYDVADQQ